MAAILMTSLLGPDAELRWANWLKLLQIPQSLILYRSPKIVTKFTRDHFFGPFDIDYCRREIGLSPPVKYFTDRSKAVPYFLCGSFMFFLSCVCYAFMRVCLFVPCGHLLGKG